MSCKDTQATLPRLISVEALAAAWGLTPATVRRWAREKTLPAVRVGKAWRFDLRDLERVIERGRRDAEAGQAVTPDLLPLPTLRAIHRHAKNLRAAAEADLDRAFDPVLSRWLDAFVQAEETLVEWIDERESWTAAA